MFSYGNNWFGSYVIILHGCQGKKQKDTVCIVLAEETCNEPNNSNNDIPASVSKKRGHYDDYSDEEDEMLV